MRIIFVRHGHPNYEDDCLTPLGHKHAAAAAERLKNEGISEFYSSTCGRAYQTAEYVAEKYHLPIVKCDFMREISWGSVDGEPIFMNGHPWSIVDDMVSKGESVLNENWAEEERFCRNSLVGCVNNIAVKMDEWLKELGYTREGLYYRVSETVNTDKTIAAFGHGGAGASIFSHLFNLPYPFVVSTFSQNYTGITIVELSNEPGALVKPRLAMLNDAKHIENLQIENVFDK